MKLMGLLREDPDIVGAGDDDYHFRDKDARPFVVGNGFVLMKNHYATHNDIIHDVNSVLDNFSDTKMKNSVKHHIVALKNRNILVGGELNISSLYSMKTEYEENENSREISKLHGRLWATKKVISFWEHNTDDESIFQHKNELEKYFADLKINLHKYKYDDFDIYGDTVKLVEWDKYFTSNDSLTPEDHELLAKLKDDPSRKVEIEISNTIKNISHGASNQEKLKAIRHIQSIIEKYKNTSIDIDFDKAQRFIDNLIKRVKGSEVEMNKAKKARYDTVAQHKAATPALEEHIKLKDLI